MVHDLLVLDHEKAFKFDNSRFVVEWECFFIKSR